MGSKRHWNPYHSTWISSLIRASNSSRNISSWNTWIESSYRDKFAFCFPIHYPTVRYPCVTVSVCVCVYVCVCVCARVPNICSCYTLFLAIGIGPLTPHSCFLSLCRVSIYFSMKTKHVCFIEIQRILTPLPLISCPNFCALYFPPHQGCVCVCVCVYVH